MYGAAALSLPPLEKWKLELAIDGVLAEEEFRANPLGKGLSDDGYYDLILAATDDEAFARRRAKSRRAAMIREGIERV